MRVVLVAAFVLGGAAPGGMAAPASAAPVPAGVGGRELAGFQLVTATAGWALLGQQLYWTDSGGEGWSDITPPGLGAGGIRAAGFADRLHGWVVITTADGAGDLRFGLERTLDGGQHWQVMPLDLFAPGEAGARAGSVFLQFIDAATGWLVVKQATSSNFSVGTLFKTQDGGDTWTRLSLPVGAPVRFSTAQDGQIDAAATGNDRYTTHDGGQTWTQQAAAETAPAASDGGKALSALSMATLHAGWAKSAAGKCAAGACVLTTRLLRTNDGGQTWSPVSLPDGQPSIEQSFAAPSPNAPGQSVGGLRVAYDGHGFDSCKNDGSLPATSDMQTWYSNGPYGVWNLYLGGSSRAACGTLTRAYLQQLAQQGWLFIPTWVGPQAPCNNLGTQMSFDPPTAYNQGVTEAFLARNVAKNLGLTLSDLSGTVIYYDIEYYLGDQACRDAVKAFISGWSGQLRATGDKAGVYGAPCGQSLSDFALIPNVPDLVWIAWWRYAGYDPSASVLGFNNCGFGDSLWTNMQRLRQYAGGHDESWGGPTFNIDSDRIHGSVSTVTDACTPGPGQVALFVYPNFGGECALKGIGAYTNTAAIGLPQQSISSLRVTSGMTLTLCQGDSFAPACSVFTADQADLGATAVGNNLASSAEVVTALPNQVYLPLVAMSALTETASITQTGRTVLH